MMDEIKFSESIADKKKSDEKLEKLKKEQDRTNWTNKRTELNLY